MKTAVTWKQTLKFSSCPRCGGTTCTSSAKTGEKYDKK